MSVEGTQVSSQLTSSSQILIDTSKEEFPQARVKRIVKAEVTDAKSVSLDANYVISKAAEVFLGELISGAGSRMLEGKRRVLAYKDVAALVSSSSRYKFLEDIVPQKISGAELIKLLQDHERVPPWQVEHFQRVARESNLTPEQSRFP
eukprot:TRINITY_DN52140_c1_g1_i2.p3 TRINITY_DN52140_c1_g1~~TRINITY_DN52140_c1_g1_i2.p3  ORF type:complete len:148 (+),score=18.93 TRINITY_DN52140_c1_g1_i2:114-557(+)